MHNLKTYSVLANFGLHACTHARDHIPQACIHEGKACMFRSAEHRVQVPHGRGQLCPESRLRSDIDSHAATSLEFSNQGQDSYADRDIKFDQANKLGLNDRTTRRVRRRILLQEEPIKSKQIKYGVINMLILIMHMRAYAKHAAPNKFQNRGHVTKQSQARPRSPCSTHSTASDLRSQSCSD